MTDLLIQYPLLLYALIGVSCLLFPLLLVFAVLSIAQGREFWTPLFKIGPKPVPPSTAALTPRLSQEEIERVTTTLKERVEEHIRSIPPSAPPATFPVPSPEDPALQLLAMQLAIDRRVMAIVLSQGGGWAGSTWAPFEAFYDLARSNRIIDQGTLDEINDLRDLTSLATYGDFIPDEQFNDAQKLAAKIMGALDEIPPGQYH
jgi:hypothetical protein